MRRSTENEEEVDSVFMESLHDLGFINQKILMGP